MSQLARKRKHELFMFRQDQRKEQKEIDDKATQEDPKTEMNHCKLCQLNFKQPKSDHFSSVLHKVSVNLLNLIKKKIALIILKIYYRKSNNSYNQLVIFVI